MWSMLLSSDVIVLSQFGLSPGFLLLEASLEELFICALAFLGSALDEGFPVNCNSPVIGRGVLPSGVLGEEPGSLHISWMGKAFVFPLLLVAVMDISPLTGSVSIGNVSHSVNCSQGKTLVLR